MPIPKPTSFADWVATNPTQRIEPTGPEKEAGWAVAQRPPAKVMNWLHYIFDQWIKYFESATDETLAQVQYDVIIGAGPAATHATLAAAVADGAVETDQRVRIDDSAAIDTAISLTKARWRIDFKPGVVYSKGGGAPTQCLRMEAEGLIVNYGRFTGWTGGGEAAILQTVAGDYCSVHGSRFGPGTTTEVDQSAVGAGKKGPVSATITEV